MRSAPGGAGGATAADPLLLVDAAGLVILAAVLAWPVPLALARARWVYRAPRAALVLWQAVGWGGGISILSAGLTLAAGDVHHRWLAGVAEIPGRWPLFSFAGWVGVLLTVGLGLWLVVVATTSAVRVTAARRAHRRRLDLLGGSAPLTLPSGGAAPAAGLSVQVIDHPHAVAYCLPGLRPRVVLTRGVLQQLSAQDDLGAVLAHERAHARGYHDLVIQPFIAWARTFPFLMPARRAVDAVGLLVEMLADDVALRRFPPASLSRALQRISSGRMAETEVLHTPGAAEWQRHLAIRVARIESAPRQQLSRAATALVYVAAVLLVVVPPTVLVVS